MALYQLDDVFGYQDANAIKKLWPSDTAPDSDKSEVGEIWLDTKSQPAQLKRYMGSGVWKTIGGVVENGLCIDISNKDLNDCCDTGMYKGTAVTNAPTSAGYFFLVLRQSVTGVLQIAYGFTQADGMWLRVKNGESWTDGWQKIWFAANDGSGSGLDADTVDTIHGTELVRKNIDSVISANTLWQDNKMVKLGTDGDLTLTHNGTNSVISNNSGGQLVINQLVNGGKISVTANRSDGVNQTLMVFDPNLSGGSVSLPNGGTSLYIGSNNDVRIYHDTSHAYITNEKTGALLICNRVNSRGMGLYCNNSSGVQQTMLHCNPDGTVVSTGNDSGLRLFNDGTQTQIQTVVKPLTVWSAANGENMYFKLNNDSGVTKSMLTLDPDADTVSTAGIFNNTRTSGIAVKFDSGHSMITVHDTCGYFVFKSGVDENNIINAGVDGGSRIALSHGGAITLSVSAQPQGATFTDDYYVNVTKTGVFVKGAMTVMDQLIIPGTAPTTLTNGSIWIA